MAYEWSVSVSVVAVACGCVLLVCRWVCPVGVACGRVLLVWPMILASDCVGLYEKLTFNLC